MKLFECIIDDGQKVFKTFLAAKNKVELREEYRENGNFEKITNVTDEYLTHKRVDLLREHLTQMGWSKAEVEIICGVVGEHIHKRNEKVRNNSRKIDNLKCREEVEEIRKSNYDKMIGE